MSTTTIATETIQYGRLTLNTSSDLIDAHSAHTQADTLEEELTRVIPGGEVDPNWGMPENWPTYRNVPPYRPLNRNQDFNTRPWGGSVPDSIFVFMMISGVQVLGTFNSLWRKSVGTMYDVRYPIGGEY